MGGGSVDHASGQAFRLAGRFQPADGLPELVTHSLDGYEGRAVRLARNPGELAAISKKLSQDRLTEPLFDTPRFARNLEGAYQQIWDLYLAGEKPRKIDVVDSGR